MTWLLLVFIGLFVGTFGTLVGVAGGFLLVPILLYLYPDKAPSTITAMTLTVAFFNALSGSLAYARLRRIDFRSGLLFSVSAVPGAILGAEANRFLNRELFQLIFGALLLIVAAYLLMKPMRTGASRSSGGNWVRQMVDSEGNVSTYAYRRGLGVAIAFTVGILSGLLGIGGGIIHVPALTQVLGFPVHIATATSQLVVCTTTFAAGAMRVLTGSFSGVVGETIVLAGGAVVGAQFGARLSRRVPGSLIVRLLAIALTLVAIRMLLAPFW